MARTVYTHTAPYITIDLVVSLPKIPCIYTVYTYMVVADPIFRACEGLGETQLPQSWGCSISQQAQGGLLAELNKWGLQSGGCKLLYGRKEVYGGGMRAKSCVCVL
jgi:hypothetical protein